MLIRFGYQGPTLHSQRRLCQCLHHLCLRHLCLRMSCGRLGVSPCRMHASMFLGRNFIPSALSCDIALRAVLPTSSRAVAGATSAPGRAHDLRSPSVGAHHYGGDTLLFVQRGREFQKPITMVGDFACRSRNNGFDFADCAWHALFAGLLVVVEVQV